MPIKDDSVVKWTTVNGEKVPKIVGSSRGNYY